MLILDTTAFYAGVPYLSNQTNYTTFEVLEEVLQKSTNKTAIQSLIDSKRLIINHSTQNSLNKVKDIAMKSGDFFSLSLADQSVLALALDWKHIKQISISSDDYAIQNVAKILNIHFSPTMTKGIKKLIIWEIFCPGCGKRYKKYSSKLCEICGTSLKRKAMKKKKSL